MLWCDTYFVPRSAGHFKRSDSTFSLATACASWNNLKSYSVTYPFSLGSLCFISPFCWLFTNALMCLVGDGGFGTKLDRTSDIFIWKVFCSTVCTLDMGSKRMVAFFRSSSCFNRSSRLRFVSSNVTLWYSGHASCVKCFWDRPPKWPIESQPSTGHFLSSMTGAAFFTTLAFILELILELLAFVRFTGLFECFASVSDSDGSDWSFFDGLKTAKNWRNLVKIQLDWHSERYLSSVLICEYLMSEWRVSCRSRILSCPAPSSGLIWRLTLSSLIAFWPVFDWLSLSFLQEEMNAHLTQTRNLCG